MSPTYDKDYFLANLEKSKDFFAKDKLLKKFNGRENEVLKWLGEVGFNKSNPRGFRLSALDLFRFVPYEAFNKLPDEQAKFLLNGLFDCLDEEDIYIRNYAMCAISRNVTTFKKLPVLEEKITKLLSDKDSAISGQAAELLGKINSPESFKVLWSRFLTAGVAFDLGTYTRDDILFNNDLCDVLDDLHFGNDHPRYNAIQTRRMQTLAASFDLARKGK